jgi:hypothetical protein
VARPADRPIRLSTDGSVVLATQSVHAIQGSESQLVVDAILQVVGDARKRAVKQVEYRPPSPSDHPDNKSNRPRCQQ